MDDPAHIALNGAGAAASTGTRTSTVTELASDGAVVGDAADDNDPCRAHKRSLRECLQRAGSITWQCMRLREALRECRFAEERPVKPSDR